MFVLHDKMNISLSTSQKSARANYLMLSENKWVALADILAVTAGKAQLLNAPSLSWNIALDMANTSHIFLSSIFKSMRISFWHHLIFMMDVLMLFWLYSVSFLLVTEIL